MAQASNSFATFTTGTRNRELLLDKIYNVSVKDTPFLSSIERETIDSVLPRWDCDDFAAAASNKVEQGNIPTIAALTGTTEYSNRTQILEKTGAVTRTQDKHRKVKPVSEYDYAVSKKMVELKKDVEYACLQNTTAIAASAGVAPQTRGMLGWVATNTSKGAGGVDPAPLTNTAQTDGGQRAFTETLFKDVLKLMHDNGADIDGTFALIPSSQRTTFDGFLAGQTRFDVAEDKKLTALLEIYIGPFGRVKAMNGRQMRQREVFIVNPDFVKLGVYDPMRDTELAKRGDAREFQINTEVALIVNNEKAHGAIRDLT